MFWAFIQGKPAPQPRPRGRVVQKGRRHIVVMYSPVTPWRRQVRQSLQNSIQPSWPLTEALAVSLEFHVERPKCAPNRPWPTVKTSGDVDNLAKAVLDAMNGLVFEDDAQVCDLRVMKIYTDKEPGVYVSVTPC